jgi:hypothetical protein
VVLPVIVPRYATPNGGRACRALHSGRRVQRQQQPGNANHNPVDDCAAGCPGRAGRAVAQCVADQCRNGRHRAVRGRRHEAHGGRECQWCRAECLPVYSPAEANAYANSGWTGVHRQFLGEPSHSHVAEQSVVLFPTAQQASAFFTASAQRWPACPTGALPTPCPAVVRCGLSGRSPTTTAF